MESINFCHPSFSVRRSPAIRVLTGFVLGLSLVLTASGNHTETVTTLEDTNLAVSFTVSSGASLGFSTVDATGTDGAAAFSVIDPQSDDAPLALGTPVVSAGGVDPVTDINNFSVSLSGSAGGPWTLSVGPAAGKPHDNGTFKIELTVTDSDDPAIVANSTTSPPTQNDATGTHKLTLTISVGQVNDRPTIAGSAVATINDTLEAGALVFPSSGSLLTIDDPDDGAPGRPATESVTATVTHSQADLGVFLELPEIATGGVTVSESSDTTLTVSGRPGDVTTYIRENLVFIPFENVVAGGQTENLSLSLSVTDPVVTETSPFTVGIFGVNDLPELSVSASPSNGYEGRQIVPFGNFSLSDVDPQSQAAVTITPSPNAGTLLIPEGATGGSVSPGTGALTFSGNTEAAEAYIQGVRYTPGTDNVTFNFTVVDVAPDSVSASTSINVQSVNRAPEIAGITTGLIRVNEGAPVQLFPNVIVVDGDGDTDLTVRVQFPEEWGTLTSGTSGAPAPFADGTDEYTLSGSIDGLAATNALRALRFNPDPSITGQLLVFTLRVSDSFGGSANDNRTRVEVTDIDQSPVVTGIPDNTPAAPQLIPPEETVYPFSNGDITDDDLLLTTTVAIDDALKGSLANSGVPILSVSDDGGALAVTSDSVASLKAGDLVEIFGEGEPANNAVHVVDSVTVGSGSFATQTPFVSNNGERGFWRRVRAVAAFADGGAGGTVVTSVDHGLGAGSTVEILGSGVAGYDAIHPVTVVDSDTFTIPVSFETDPAAGYLSNVFVEQSGGLVLVGSPSDAAIALRGLSYSVSESFLFPPDAPGGTTFVVTVNDGLTLPTVVNYSIVLQSSRRNLLVTSSADGPVPPNWVAGSTYAPGDEVVFEGNVYARGATTDSESSFDPLLWSDEAPSEGMLRVVLALAEDNDTITFALPSYPAVIRLGSPLVVRDNLRFAGPGADNLTISGDSDGDLVPDTQLLEVRANVVMEGVTLSRGTAATGGGISVSESGDLTLRFCAVRKCVASQWGGGIDVDRGALTLENCLLEGNSTSSVLGLGGGGVSLFTTKACTINNSTFSGNIQASSTGFGGGGLYVENPSPETKLRVDVRHCTFAANSDAANAGSSIQANVFGTGVHVQNTIVADGQGGNLEVVGAGEILSLGGNISDDLTRAVLTQSGAPQAIFLFDHATDKRQINPGLGPLTHTVGPLPAHPLAASSQAINTATGETLPNDGRGVVRSDGSPDRGSFEFGSTRQVVINEIQFAAAAKFVELFVPRDSEPVRLDGYELMVDGGVRHVFPTGSLIQPGFGTVVTDTDLGSSLETRGVIALRAPGRSLPAVSSPYNGVFADLTDPRAIHNLGDDSITLAPQFNGVAFVPHGFAQSPLPGMNGVDPDRGGPSESPGADSGETPFGGNNAPPFASADEYLLREDEAAVLTVLDNDLDADGLDELFIIDVEGAVDPVSSDASVETANGASVETANGATVTIDPRANGAGAYPDRGLRLLYDPRNASAIQSLPVGAELLDTFEYSIIDITTGSVLSYAGVVGDGPTTIESPAHRLITGVQIVLTGPYDGTHQVTVVDADHFTIPVSFAGAGATGGVWRTLEPRSESTTNPIGSDETKRSTALVSVRILGTNDAPEPALDVAGNDGTTGDTRETIFEDEIMRFMGDAALAGNALVVFDTDPLYAVRPTVSELNLLANDEDPDLEEGGENLDVIGVFGKVTEVSGYVQGPGQGVVEVTSSAPHGLEEGDPVLITGYGGYPSYNGVHLVEVVDADTFSIPTDFVDNDTTAPGVWVPYNLDGNGAAISEKGAQVVLEIRADHRETNVLYIPRTSLCLGEFSDNCLDGIPDGEGATDSFYYAVEDIHGGIGLAKVTVNLTGVNDDPVPGADPGGLAGFQDLLEELFEGEDASEDDVRDALAEILSGVSIEYLRPGANGSMDATASSSAYPDAGLLEIPGLPATDEETPYDFNIDPEDVQPGDLLANDTDVDRDDALTIGLSDTTSREGASLTISPDGNTLTYDPSASTSLNALSREELIVDTFEVRVDDGVGTGVISLVAILVRGLNDTPEADHFASTTVYGVWEDELLAIGPLGVLADDLEIDQSGGLPDDRRILVPVYRRPTETPVFGAFFSTNVNTAGSIPLAGNITGFVSDPSNAAQTVVNAPGHLFAAGDEVVIRGTGNPEYDSRFLVASSDPGTGTFSIPVPFVTGSALDTGTWAALQSDGGAITRFSSDPGDPGVTVVTAPGHSLGVDEEVVVRNTGVPAYDGQFQIVASDPETGVFTISTPFVDGTSLAGGEWFAVRSTLTFDPRESLFDHTNPSVFAFDGLGQGEWALDTLAYEVFDGSFIFAQDDLFKVAADTEGVELAVLANDRNLTGITSAITLVEAGPASNGGTVEIDLNDDGETVIAYVPQPNFVGDEVFRYIVQDEWGNRDTAQVTARVTVNQLNGNLQANDDYFTVALGQTPELNVLANDNIIPAEVGRLAVTAVTGAGLDEDDVAEDGAIVFPATTTGSFSFTYEISGGGTARAEATVSVEVVDREGSLFTRDDNFSVLIGSTDNVLDVLSNDNILPGNGQPLGVSLTGNAADLPEHGTISVNAEGTALLYTPEPGFVGEDQFSYRASDGFGSTNEAQVTVTVGTLVTNNDFFVLADDADDEVLPVLLNDQVLDTAGGEVSITGVAATPAGPFATPLTITDSSSGAIGSVRLSGGQLLIDGGPGTGEGRFFYEIAGQGGNKAVGEATVVVLDDGLSASPDYYSVLVDSAATDLDVLANDTSIPARPLVIVGIGTGLDAPDSGGSVELVDTPDGQRIRYEPAPGFQGEETFTYLISDSDVTDDARVVVRIGGGDLYANKDAFTVYYDEEDDGDVVSFSLPILLNDRVLPQGGESLVVTGVGIDDTLGEANAPDEEGVVNLGANGTTLIYTPAARTDTGFCFEEKFTYVVTDGSNRRAEAQVVVTVKDRRGVLGQGLGMEVKDDAFTVDSESAGNVLDVLANDAVKPAPASNWEITAVDPPVLVPANPNGEVDGGAATISGGAILYSPRPGFVGTVEFYYYVSDGAGGTGSAKVTVRVGVTRVCDDLFVVLSNTADNELGVLANDGVLPNGDAESDFVLADDPMTDPLMPAHGEAFVDKGAIFYTPDANFVGTDSFVYWVVDDSGGKIGAVATVDVQEAGSDRSGGLVNIRVDGVNDAPRIDSTSVTMPSITDKDVSNGLPFVGIELIEVDKQGQQVVRVIVTIEMVDGVEPGVFDPATLGGFIELAPGVFEFVGDGTPTAAEAEVALRNLLFIPMENWVTVTDPPVPANFTFTVQIEDNDPAVTTPLSATDSSLSIDVTAVNDPPVLTGTVAGQVVYYKSPINAFAGVAIEEVDDHTLQLLTVDVTVDQPDQGVLVSPNDEFESVGGGTYRFVGTAAQATLAFGELSFVPDADGLQPGLNPADFETTSFTIVVDDQFGGVATDSTTTVTAIHGYIGEVLADDGEKYDRLGWSVAASATVVVAGAPEEETNGRKAGAAYVYEPQDGLKSEWVQKAKLLATGGNKDDLFGTAVGTSGNLIVVGAPEHKANGKESGAAYVFERQGLSWVQIAKLVPMDGDKYDRYGQAVAISGDTVVIGAPRKKHSHSEAGSAYIYQRDGNTNQWDLVKKLVAPVPGYKKQYAYAVAIDGDTVLVGSPYDGPKGKDSGSVFFYERNLGPDIWGLSKKVSPVDGQEEDEFGFAVDLSGDRAVVGAHMDETLGNKAGAAYILERNEGGMSEWGSILKLLAPDGRKGDQFGRSVGIDGDEVIIGMPKDGDVEYKGNESKRGSAYLFRIGDESATLLEKIVSLDRVNNEEAGFSVALGGHTAAVGIPFNEVGGVDKVGAVIIYRTKFNNPPAAKMFIPDQVATIGTKFSLNVPALAIGTPDVGEGMTYEASVGGVPFPIDNIDIDAATGVIMGTPTTAAVYQVLVEATDEDGLSAQASFTLTVVDPNAAPATAPLLALMTSAEPEFSFEPRGADGTSPTVTMRFRGSAASLASGEVRYVVESSRDLMRWVPASGTLQKGRSLDGGFQELVWASRLPVSSAPAEYYRLRVETNWGSKMLKVRDRASRGR